MPTATTEHVKDKLAEKADAADAALTGDPTAPTAAGSDNDTSIATTAFVQNELADYAPLASPALTGTPTAPTAAPGTNTTQVATTAFVQAAIPGTLVEVASDGAAAILNTTGGLYLAESTSGAKGITETSQYAGQKVHIRLAAASGGSYTLAVLGGTLTFDAANESALIQRTAEDDEWVVLDLNGATIV